MDGAKLVKPFYQSRGDAFVPTEATVGPWDPRLQHGSPLAALVARCVARDGSLLRIAQLTLDFLGPVGLEPLFVEPVVTRPGKKIELSTVTVRSAERPLLRASVWRVRAGDPGSTPSANVSAPPAMPAEATTKLFPGVPRFGYGESLEWRFVSGSFADLGAATVWSRLLVPIVDQEPPSQVARVLAMVDSANGISAELDVRHYLFVPVSLTVSLARVPVGEWMGMSARTLVSGSGGGTTRAELFDSAGSLGEAVQTLFIESR